MALLTYKNYRAFSDEEPLRIKFGNQLTALVGPNNSGKSCFLRSIYEFRPLWEIIRNSLNGNAQRNGPYTLRVPQYLGVTDPEELFYHNNKRPLIIELDITDELEVNNTNIVDKIVMSCTRDKMNDWNINLYINGESIVDKINKMQNRNPQHRHPNPINISHKNEAISDRLAFLHNSLYIGPFRSAIHEASADHYDLTIGSKFIAEWDKWKNGPVSKNRNAITQLSKQLADIFKFKNLEINKSNDGTNLNVRFDDYSYNLSEMGAGLAEFIVVLGNIVIKSPRLILIDEPELHLHPSLQISFLTTLSSFSSQGLIFATHSLGLARSVASDIYSFVRNEKFSRVKPYEGLKSYAEFLGEMGFGSIREMGYEKLLLVEGVNDVLAIRYFLRLLEKDTSIVVMHLGGSEMINGRREQELGELQRLSESIHVLIDSERKNANDPLETNRSAFKSICEKLKFSTHVTERRALENYFSDEAVKKHIGNGRALKHFESIKDVQVGWAKRENWQIAKQMLLNDLENTDLLSFLRAI